MSRSYHNIEYRPQRGNKYRIGYANDAYYRIWHENGWFTAIWDGSGKKPKETVYSATTLRELSAKMDPMHK